MADIAISQDYTAAGEWRTPGGAEVAGNMKWSDRRVTLELGNSLSIPPEKITELFESQNEVPHYPFIHGSTTTGELVTVLDAYLSKWSTNFGPAGVSAPSEVMGHTAVIGAHVNATTKYSEMRFVVPGLHLWLALGGINHTAVRDEGSKTLELLYSVKTVYRLLSACWGSASVVTWAKMASTPSRFALPAHSDSHRRSRVSWLGSCTKRQR
jgi:ApeA N-terminal domain 1